MEFERHWVADGLVHTDEHKARMAKKQAAYNIWNAARYEPQIVHSSVVQLPMTRKDWMAIIPKCERCGDELHVPGALLFAPPDDADESIVRKMHLCVECFVGLFDDQGYFK